VVFFIYFLSSLMAMRWVLEALLRNLAACKYNVSVFRTATKIKRS